jgi:hypothetical protein
MRLTVNFRKCLCLTLWAAGLPGIVFEAAADAPVAAEYHCAGLAQLDGNTNLATLHKALTIPSAAAMRKMAVSKAAILLMEDLKIGTNWATASLLEPVASDVVSAESLGTFGSSTTNALSFVLALRLDEKRAQVWKGVLDKALNAAGDKFTAGEFSGWQWKMSGSDPLWVIPARDWLLVGRGDELLAVRSKYLAQVKSQGRPGSGLTDHWLEAEVDLPRLFPWLPEALRLFKPAHVQFSVATGTNFLMTARVIYPDAVPWESAPWRPPKQLVPDRHNSLTVGENIDAFLNLDPGFARVTDSPLTNQFYLWAGGGMPFLTFMAWPAANTNVLAKFSTEAAKTFTPQLKDYNGTILVWQTNLHRLALGNLRVMIPTVEAVEDKAGAFLLMSCFPRMPTQPASDDLWKDIKGRNNLVYYDWELTGSRLQDWRLLGRILLLRLPNMTPATHVEDMWLTEMIPWWAGNTVTEVTRVAPNELSVVRHSPMGFTGIEIFYLSEWLCGIGSDLDDLPVPSLGRRAGAPPPP